MWLIKIARELWWTLIDVVECGDLWGHLATWWEVATGRLRADDRVEVCYG